MQKEAASDRYSWPMLILAAVALAVVAETFLIAKVPQLFTAADEPHRYRAQHCTAASHGSNGGDIGHLDSAHAFMPQLLGDQCIHAVHSCNMRGWLRSAVLCTVK